MQHFSHEYVEKLLAEHKIISASIAKLTGPDYPRYARNHGMDPVAGAVSNLTAKKVELEAMIDVLTEYLNG